MLRPFFLALCLTLGLGISAAMAAPVSGQPAPDFTATDTNGVSHTLSGFKGKTVVLEWTNPECPYVVKHYQQGHMQALQKAHVAAGGVWIRVNSSASGKSGHLTADAANQDAAAQKVAASATILDPDGTIGRLYDAKTTPHLFVINPEGVLAYQGAIDSDDSKKTEAIAGATNYVTAALQDVAAGRPVATQTTKPYGCSVKYAD